MWVSYCRSYPSTSMTISHICHQTATANLQACSISQVITLKLLTSWGYDGFFAHPHTVSQFYRKKRDVFERALHKHLQGLAEWSTPEAGMFVWYAVLDSPSLSSSLIPSQVQTP